MLTEERYAAIIERLHQQGIVKLQELVDVLGASESTIRRDLIDLESRQMLKRIHGGAALMNEKTLEPGMEEKTSKTFNKSDDCSFGCTGDRKWRLCLSGCRYNDAGHDSLY